MYPRPAVNALESIFQSISQSIIPSILQSIIPSIFQSIFQSYTPVIAIVNTPGNTLKVDSAITFFISNSKTAAAVNIFQPTLKSMLLATLYG